MQAEFGRVAQPAEATGRGDIPLCSRCPDDVHCIDTISRMRFHRTSRFLTAWIAVLAILMGAFAPSVSHALGSKGEASFIEVCTSLGAKWVEQESSSTQQVPPSGDAQVSEHCPYCSIHANTLAVPPAPWALALDPALPELLPTAFLAAPRTLHAWLSAQPRAPPSLS